MATVNTQQLLTDTLSTDANIRIAAELKLSDVLQHPEAGLALSQLALTQNADLSLRQSASIILRKYVTERWSPYFPQFKGNAPPVETKVQIRQAIFNGLSDPDRKIRSLSAHVLSSIASCDWPDEYPDLLNGLIELISSSSPNSVHGAMQVLTEFIKSDLTEDQILPVLRQLLPVLLVILNDAQQHSPLTRSRSVSVFCQCVTALYMVKEQHPQAVKEATENILPIWLATFKEILEHSINDIPNQSTWDGLTVRVQVFKALDIINTAFPRGLKPHVESFLDSSLADLKSILPAYEIYYVNATESTPGSTEDEPVDLPYLICPLFDLVSNIVRGGKAKQWLDSQNQSQNLTNLVGLIFRFAQMTAEDEETWVTNANAFVAQEEDETETYGVRVAGFGLLNTILGRSPAEVCVTFQDNLQQIIGSCQTTREAGVPSWWKPLEAGLAAIGSQAEDILECIEDEQDSSRQKPLDVEQLLANVIPSLLHLTEFPFLQGRGFVFASQFAKVLPLQMAGQYLEVAMHVIESDSASIPVKVSAVKAVHNFCQGAEDSALKPYVSRIAQDLGPFLLLTTEDTLSLVLSTMSVVLDVDKASWLTTDLASSLVLATLEVWTKNNKDPIFLSIFTDILASLAKSSAPGVYETVVKQALPTLCTSITTAKPEESWIAGSAIDLVSSLVRGAPESGLGDGFFALLAPNLFNCLKIAEDRDVLQNGVVCLTLLVRKDCSQILSWHDPSGESGLGHVLKLIAKLLRNEDESGGLVIGDLIIHVLRRAGESVLPVLPELLHAMVERMLTAKTATFLQSLVIPFVFLIHNQADTVLGMLESTTVQGRTALDIVIQTWCENAETFQGFWPTRISTLTLSQLYVSDRPTLHNLLVKGDIIIKPETKHVIMTRSRTKTNPHEFTSVSFPVKVLKLLVHDLRSKSESVSFPGGEGFVDSDDEDEEWTEEEQQHQGFKEDEFAFLSEMLGPRGANLDNDDIFDENDDEDLKKDPISQIDMKEHIITFFKDCAARNANNFAANVDQLTAEEILVVHQLVRQ
ncbi:ARM repeat-containing protein [Boletus edulis BED1]|uniref:ARM repeat-containing protein n=1 Tax=Boletus edulis BED1 TaxID=1328754 RepID=A0AAD4BN46_BOLED|nr:ARM repeat-containing protein [Boletus edulis BED1]